MSFNNEGVPAWEERVIRRGLPSIELVLGRALDIRPGVEARGRGRRLGASSTSSPTASPTAARTSVASDSPPPT